MLSISNLTVRYDNIVALNNVSIGIRAGAITALIGANGAGKTSLLNAVSGLVRYEGMITFEGVNLSRMPPHEIARLGIIHVPEGRRIFGNLTVRENLYLAAWGRDKKRLDYVFNLFPRLKERINQRGATLSGGEQQMLAVGRALMSQPKLILLDEPSMGLAPLFVKEIFNIIESINKEGTTMILVEQNAMMALKTARYGIVMEKGAVGISAEAVALMDNPCVREAYLGI